MAKSKEISPVRGWKKRRNYKDAAVKVLTDAYCRVFPEAVWNAVYIRISERMIWLDEYGSVYFHKLPGNLCEAIHKFGVSFSRHFGYWVLERPMLKKIESQLKGGNDEQGSDPNRYG